jgi:hypothetical protein
MRDIVPGPRHADAVPMLEKFRELIHGPGPAVNVNLPTTSVVTRNT